MPPPLPGAMQPHGFGSRGNLLKSDPAAMVAAVIAMRGNEGLRLAEELQLKLFTMNPVLAGIGKGRLGFTFSGINSLWKLQPILIPDFRATAVPVFSEPEPPPGMGSGLWNKTASNGTPRPGAGVAPSILGRMGDRVISFRIFLRPKAATAPHFPAGATPSADPPAAPYRREGYRALALKSRNLK